MEIFRFPQIRMVYTRRIINPIGGAKLTGKVGRFTYGLLSALDANPTESLWDVSNGGGKHDENALFNIFRIKTDVFSESTLGFCFADKEIDGKYNRVLGIDGQFKFKNKFFLSFQAIGSKTKFEDEETFECPHCGSAVPPETIVCEKCDLEFWSPVKPATLAEVDVIDMEEAQEEDTSEMTPS